LEITLDVPSVLCAKINTKAGATFQEIADHVNSLGTSWKAKVPKFDDLEDVRRLCGTPVDGAEELPEKADDSANMDIPEEFDVRSNWPNCASVSGDIRDQSDCGSCWAHGATEAFNDRYCIATGKTALLSTEDSLANSGCGSCNGGQPSCVLSWIGSSGVVTGGDYTDIGKGDTCAPYSLPTCQHHNWKPPTPEHPACPSQQYPTPSRFSSCKEKSYTTSFQQDKVKGGAAYSIRGETNIQSDIMQYGSVSAVFTVYDDLPAYESGVYHHTSGSVLGGHAVKMIGWGTEDGTPYWLIVNSWNEDWGNKGLFKIKRGNNECGIESGISASQASTTIDV
jgi:cathepsin B